MRRSKVIPRTPLDDLLRRFGNSSADRTRFREQLLHPAGHILDVRVIGRVYVSSMSRSVPLILVLAAIVSFASVQALAQNTEFLPPAPAGKEWKLIWNDEFEGTALDETKWNRLGDWKRRDGFWVKEDAYLSGRGTLILRTKKDGDRYTCGAVNTQGKFEHAFGFYVARCKAPRQPGHWPAFWMMSSGVGKVGDEEYLKLTEEIGKWGGDITKAELPDFFEVEFVRVYELSYR
jgi:hypothetical protein